jgi:hypothetical protein
MIRWLGVVLLLLPFAAAAQDSLLESRTIVTGTRVETRVEGLALGLRDVLAKRSGDPALLDDPRVDTFSAPEMVEDYLYLDRMSDLPRHDEQGSRDRPFVLVAHFSGEKVDAALTDLGEKPWLDERPKLLVRVAITDLTSTYPLTSDGDNDERHRQALFAAAERYGMHLVLMPLALANAVVKYPGAMPVSGALRWSDADYGWVGAWRSGDHAWGIKGVSFDEAYRNLVQGAMAIASGHDLPRAQ